MQRLLSDSGKVAEFALVVPIFLFIVLAALQIGLLVIVRYDVKHVARETARWVAVHPNTVDTDIVTHAQADILPGMVSPITAANVTVTPACSALDGNGHCASRPSGQPLTVAIVYDASSSWFLPSHVGAGLSVSLPTVMSSQVSMVVE